MTSRQGNCIFSHPLQLSDVLVVKVLVLVLCCALYEILMTHTVYGMVYDNGLFGVRLMKTIVKYCLFKFQLGASKASIAIAVEQSHAQPARGHMPVTIDELIRPV